MLSYGESLFFAMEGESLLPAEEMTDVVSRLYPLTVDTLPDLELAWDVRTIPPVKAFKL